MAFHKPEIETMVLPTSITYNYPYQSVQVCIACELPSLRPDSLRNRTFLFCFVVKRHLLRSSRMTFLNNCVSIIPSQHYREMH